MIHLGVLGGCGGGVAAALVVATGRHGTTQTAARRRGAHTWRAAPRHAVSRRATHLAQARLDLRTRAVGVHARGRAVAHGEDADTKEHIARSRRGRRGGGRGERRSRAGRDCHGG